MDSYAMPITPFTSTCGSGLLAKLPSLLAPPSLIVTMQDLWQGVPVLEQTFRCMDKQSCCVFFVTSLEESDLERSFLEIATSAKSSAAGVLRTVVGIGGGQAIDVAKYFAWRSGTTKANHSTVGKKRCVGCNNGSAYQAEVQSGNNNLFCIASGSTDAGVVVSVECAR